MIILIFIVKIENLKCKFLVTSFTRFAGLQNAKTNTISGAQFNFFTFSKISQRKRC